MCRLLLAYPPLAAGAFAAGDLADFDERRIAAAPLVFAFAVVLKQGVSGD